MWKDLPLKTCMLKDQKCHTAEIKKTNRKQKWHEINGVKRVDGNSEGKRVKKDICVCCVCVGGAEIWNSRETN